MKHLRIWLYWPLCILLRTASMGPLMILSFVGKWADKGYWWLHRYLPSIYDYELRRYFRRKRKQTTEGAQG